MGVGRSVSHHAVKKGNGLKYMILNFIKSVFNKPTKNFITFTDLEIGLKKWEDFRWIHPTFISEILNTCNLNDLAIALVHCEINIYNKFLHYAKELFYTESLAKSIGDDLEELIIKHKNVTKLQSDKMKAQISNNILHQDYIKYRNLPYGHSPVI